MDQSKDREEMELEAWGELEVEIAKDGENSEREEGEKEMEGRIMNRRRRRWCFGRQHE